MLHIPELPTKESKADTGQTTRVRSSDGSRKPASDMRKVEPEDHMSFKPEQVRIEELLHYCNRIGADDKIAKFTEPDFYVDNVELSRYDNERIKGLVRAIDRKVLEQMDGACSSDYFSSNAEGISSAQVSSSSMVSVLTQFKNIPAEDKFIARVMQDEVRKAAQQTPFNRLSVGLSEIPIDVLYNPAINKLKGTEMAGTSESFVPIEFKVEDETMAFGGNFEVSYKT